MIKAVLIAIFALGVPIALASGWTLRARWIDRKIDMMRHPRASPNEISGNAPSKGDCRETIVIGDSRVAQWPPTLLSRTVSRRGMPGETTSHLVLRFHANLQICRPNTVLIVSGINDLVAASFLGQSEGEHVAVQVAEALIQLAQDGARAGATVYVATIIPAGKPDLLRRLAWSGSIVTLVDQANGLLRRHIWQPPTSLLDFAAMLDTHGSGVLPDEYRRDTLHLNDVGYQRLSAELPGAFRTTGE